MIQRTLRAIAAACAIVFLAACGTPVQLPVGMKAASLDAQGTRIGVAMTPLPKVDTYWPGASCLLCMAAASMANSTLTAYTKTLPYEDLPKLKEMMAESVRKHGAQVVLIEEPLKVGELPKNSGQGANLARRDFSSLQAKYRIDKLLLIEITQIGFERTYSAYFPTSDAKAVLRGSGSLIDLKTNALEWYEPLNQLHSADGAWDEPPKYPGLTNAYFQVLEEGKDRILKPIAQ